MPAAERRIPAAPSRNSPPSDEHHIQRSNRESKGWGMFEDSTWRSSAECRGENAVYFFAPSHFERKPEKDLREGMARALCRRCKVQQQCLDYSIQVEEGHGIWGGLNELERKRLLRRRRAESA